MPSTFFGLNIGASGLRSFQVAVNTTANNIANVQTKGYTRQQATLAATTEFAPFATAEYNLAFSISFSIRWIRILSASETEKSLNLALVTSIP